MATPTKPSTPAAKPAQQGAKPMAGPTPQKPAPGKPAQGKPNQGKPGK